jgi:hypothetical protein
MSDEQKSFLEWISTEYGNQGDVCLSAKVVYQKYIESSEHQTVDKSKELELTKKFLDEILKAFEEYRKMCTPPVDTKLICNMQEMIDTYEAVKWLEEKKKDHKVQLVSCYVGDKDQWSVYLNDSVTTLSETIVEAVQKARGK